MILGVEYGLSIFELLVLGLPLLALVGAVLFWKRQTRYRKERHGR